MGTLVVVLLGVLLGASPAAAHVSLVPGTVEAGTDAVVTLEVDHGCGTSATTRLEVRLPDELTGVTPGPTRSWRVEQQDRVLVLTAATPLPSDLPDSLSLAFRAPEEPGTVLAFPTVQTCERGEESWIQVATDGSDDDLDRPAPTLRVTEATASGPGARSHWRVTGPLLALATLTLGGLVLVPLALRARTRSRSRRTAP